MKFRLSEKPLKWLFYGDSITHGASHTCGARDFTEHFRERVIWEMRRKHDFVLNAAYSGFRSDDLLINSERILSVYTPDVVFIMIGINDCITDLSLEEFENNLKKTAFCFQSSGARIVWQTSPPPFQAEHTEKYPPFAEIIRKVAGERNEMLIDHYEYWLTEPVRHLYWLADQIHPNADGHKVIAQTIFKALNIWDDKAATCCYFVP